MRRFAQTMLMAAAVVGSAPTQDRTAGAPRLADCIEAPYAYLRLDRVADAPGAAGPRAGAGSVHRLLADPALDAVLGTGVGADGSTRALSLVRGMLHRGPGELELVLTGIVGRQGAPLLLLRASLLRDEADRLRLVLEGGGVAAGAAEGEDATAAGALATRHRLVGERQTWRLRGGGEGPGEVVELALLGDDLVVGNDGSAMREVLEVDPTRTSATPDRLVLSADPRFTSLHDRIDTPKGSLLVYGDWARLGQRLRGASSGATAQLLGSSGLGAAKPIMITVTPMRADLAATLLLEFDERATGGGRGGPRGASDIDGWFAATQPVAAKTLLRELPRGGLGGLVLSVDLAAVAASSPRSAHLIWDLRRAFRDFGLDFERNVLSRLGARGTVQLHFGPLAEGSAFAAVAPVYAVRAKSRAAAHHLFSDLRRVVETTGLGALVDVEVEDGGGRRAEVLELRRDREVSACIGVHDESLLLAEDRDTLTQVLEDLHQNRPRGRRDQAAGAAVQSIGGERVAGLFDLDLSPLFERIAAALPGVDVSALPARHVGYLDTEDRESGTLVRVRVLSSR